MKIKVIKRFKDKYTKSILEAGQILEITQKRFEEINSTAHSAFVEEIKDDPLEKEEKSNTEKESKKDKKESTKKK